jgi:hypothetical protein
VSGKRIKKSTDPIHSALPRDPDSQQSAGQLEPTEDDVASQAEAEFWEASDDYDLNGTNIEWRYWMEQMPEWTAAQAARLMRRLDPDIYRDLNVRPKGAGLQDVERAVKAAQMIERAAVAQGRTADTPDGWLAWGKASRYALSQRFVWEVERSAQTRAAVNTEPNYGANLKTRRAPSKASGDAVKGEVQQLPEFSMSRSALVKAHLAKWPTIESDLKDASKNGLASAKAGKRDWNETHALEWARSRGKLLSANTTTSILDSAMRKPSPLPSRTHRLKG